MTAKKGLSARARQVVVANVGGVPTVLQPGQSVPPVAVVTERPACGICTGTRGDHMHPEYGIVGVPNSAYASFDSKQLTVTCLLGDTTTYEVKSKQADFVEHMKSHFHIVREDPSVPESARHHSPPKVDQATMPTKKPPAKPAKGKSTPATKGATTKVPRLRKRVIEAETNKNGDTRVNVYVPVARLKSIMDEAKLGSSFGDFVRDAWTNRPEKVVPQATAENPTVGRGVYMSKAQIKEIHDYEAGGGNLDLYILARIIHKLGA